MDRNPIRILLIEDNPDDARLLQEFLKEAASTRFELAHADRLTVGLQRLDEEVFDVLLLDLGLPDSRGLATFNQAYAYAPGIPIIVLAGLDDDKLAVQAVQAGAQDYLVKSQLDGNLLARAMHYAIERQRLYLDVQRKTSALLYSEARFHNMIEHNADSIVIVDRNGLICFVNPATETLFGRSAQELVGDQFHFSLKPDTTTEIEITRNGKCRTTAIVEMRVVETEWDDHTVYMASLRDITERKQTQEALQRSQAEWQSTFNAMSDWVSLLDVETGQIMRSNRRSDEFVGIPLASVIGQACYKVVHDTEDPIPDCPLATMLNTRRRESIELEMPPGSNCWIMVTVDPVTDEDGNLVSAVHIVRNITKRKQTEKTLQEYSERLEEMVAERTQALEAAQEQLVRREKLVVLGQLAGGVAHELRNPLGAIGNATYYLNMALETPEADVKETLEILEKEVETSEAIINSLLDFARTSPPLLYQVDINNLLQEAINRISAPAGVEVISRLDNTLPSIQADPNHLKPVFENLIRNAIQAMSPPYGTTKGRLVVKSALAEPGWVAVSFVDTGVGIPKENLEKVFEPLFTTRAKGIGLGLALAKSLIEGHGGTLKVESEEGRGSAFVITLPIKDVVP